VQELKKSEEGRKEGRKADIESKEGLHVRKEGRKEGI
jgi:hypothetical protein